jgi:hypothetical protein
VDAVADTEPGDAGIDTTTAWVGSAVAVATPGGATAPVDSVEGAATTVVCDAASGSAAGSR